MVHSQQQTEVIMTPHQMRNLIAYEIKKPIEELTAKIEALTKLVKTLTPKADKPKAEK